MRTAFPLVVALAVACGASQSPAPSGPSCDAVADHLVQLAVMDNDATGAPPDLEAAGDSFRQQCASSPWSEARRSCLAEARTQEDTLDCPAD